MKQIKIFLLLIFISTLSFSQVSMGGTTPSSAAVLHIQTSNFSTTNRGGFIMPVVTEAQQALIPVTAVDDGMQVFVSDASTGKWCWDIYDGQAAVWRSINCAPVPTCANQIYLEDFNSYALHTGRDRRTDSGDYVTGVFAPWIIDDSAANTPIPPSPVGQDNDYAYTNAAGEMELDNTDGAISLTTAAIDISGYATVCFSVDVRGTGKLEYDSADHSTDADNNKNDFTNVEYSIDGGPWTMIVNFGGNGTVNHTLVAGPSPGFNGNFPDSTVTQMGLSGTTLRIRLTSQVWASDETIYYDNIIVSGG